MYLVYIVNRGIYTFEDNELTEVEELIKNYIKNGYKPDDITIVIGKDITDKILKLIN